VLSSVLNDLFKTPAFHSWTADVL